MKAVKVLRIIKDEFVYGGHLLSLGASGIIYTIMLIFNLKINLSLLAIIYLMPQIIYSYDHLKGAKKDAKTNPERAKHFQTQKNKIISLIIIYVAVLLTVLVYLKNWEIGLTVFLIIISGMLYTKFFKDITKRIPAFKNFFVAFVWAFSPTVLILLHFHFKLNISLLLLFIFILLKFIVSTVFFDIKDMESDKSNLIKTLPAIFGKGVTINFLQIVNILSLAPIIIGVWFNLLPSFSLGLLIFYFYSFYYLEKAKTDKANINFLSYILADGEYLLWPITILLIKY